MIESLLMLAGVGQLVLAAGSLAIPRVLRWSDDLSRVRPLIRQIFWTYAGYILGFPNDTPESARRDIEIIKKEMPLDVLEFFFLTPLPGSERDSGVYC